MIYAVVVIPSQFRSVLSRMGIRYLQSGRKRGRNPSQFRSVLSKTEVDRYAELLFKCRNPFSIQVSSLIFAVKYNPKILNTVVIPSQFRSVLSWTFQEDKITCKES